MMIIEEVRVSDEMLPSGRFSDVGTGTYEGCLVAMRTMRVGRRDDFRKIGKVSVDHVSRPLGMQF